jgi:hypothetical protein
MQLRRACESVTRCVRAICTVLSVFLCNGFHLEWNEQVCVKQRNTKAQSELRKRQFK